MRRLLVLSVALCALAVAQDQAPAGGRTQTMTRGVAKYTALENNLFQALQDNNRAGTENTLAPDFEAWAAEKLPPTPRADWMQAFVGNLKSFRIRNMAVHEYGDVSVVSFLLDRSGSVNGKPMSPVLFIVDVWRNQGDKLLVRYASAPANPAAAESTPTGKQ